MVVVVWLIVTLAPGVPPRVRVWLWWLVTARLLWALVPLPAIEIPWGYDVSTPAAVDAMLMASAADPLPAAAGHPPPVAWSISWRRATIAVAGALYVVGLLWQLAGLGADLVRTRRLARRAQRVPAEIDQRAAALASCVPMQAPPVRISSENPLPPCGRQSATDAPAAAWRGPVASSRPRSGVGTRARTRQTSRSCLGVGARPCTANLLLPSTGSACRTRVRARP